MASFINKKVLQNVEIKSRIEDLINGINLELNPYVSDFSVMNFMILKDMVNNHD